MPTCGGSLYWRKGLSNRIIRLWWLYRFSHNFTRLSDSFVYEKRFHGEFAFACDCGMEPFGVKKAAGWSGFKEARLAIFSYIEGWYNPHRRHSSIAYHAPMAYEKLHQSQA